MKTSIVVKLAGTLLSLGLLAVTAAPVSADRDDWGNARWKHRHCEWCEHHPRLCRWEHRGRCGLDWNDRWKDRKHNHEWWETHRHDWDDHH